MRERIYLGRLEELIKNYHFDLPLSIYLRQEFHKRRNMGSRDRKRTREDVFNYFRIGKNLPELSIPQRVAIGGFICNSNGNPELDYILSHHSPFLPELLPQNLETKLAKIKSELPEFEVEKIFPFSGLLSPQINKKNFLLSFLKKPGLWIRVRKNHREEVINELKVKNISFESNEDFPLAFSFANSTPVHELKTYDSGSFEIQDLNSQRCANNFPLKSSEKWWDACAGSGGKSLAMLDREPGLKLTFTDVRESSLQNLKLRMKKASLRISEIKTLDLSIDNQELPGPFDGIIADVPCSGSGTWARSPEILSYFSESSIFDKYVPLQRKIVQNLTSALKTKKHLIYITCSVFKSENEDNIKYFEENFDLKCLSSEYYEGSEIGADTMFIAILEKSH